WRNNKIKLSGDGTNIGKQMSVVNITFTILNEKKIAMSEKGNYILAVIKTSESYDTLAESLADIITKMQDLQKISVDDKTFDFEYFLGGDWKFLACVCGVGAANANHACIWCKCANLDRCDTIHISKNSRIQGSEGLQELWKYHFILHNGHLLLRFELGILQSDSLETNAGAKLVIDIHVQSSDQCFEDVNIDHARYY
ncbi:Hypothetical predicted protein, partial [Paramuricea clavata]